MLKIKSPFVQLMKSHHLLYKHNIRKPKNTNYKYWAIAQNFDGFFLGVCPQLFSQPKICDFFKFEFNWWPMEYSLRSFWWNATNAYHLHDEPFWLNTRTVDYGTVGFESLCFEPLSFTLRFFPKMVCHPVLSDNRTCCNKTHLVMIVLCNKHRKILLIYQQYFAWEFRQNK